MRRRSVFKILAVLVLLVLLVPATLLGLAATQTGTRWLVQHAGWLVAGRLSVESTRGTLLSELTLGGVDYRAPPTHITIERLEFAWWPSALLRGRVHVQRLDLAGVRYQGPAAAPTAPGGFELPRHSPLPMWLQVDEARVSDVDVRYGEEHYRLSQAELSARAGAHALVVERLEVQAPAFEARVHGRLVYGAPPTLSVRIAWQATPAGGPRVIGEGHVQGPLNDLQVEHRVSTPFVLDTRGTAGIEGANVHLDLKGSWRKLTWPLADGSKALSTEGEYRVHGDLQRLAFELSTRINGQQTLQSLQARLQGSVAPSAPYPFDAHVSWSAALADHAAVHGVGDISGDREHIRLDHRITAPASVHTQGTVELAGSEPTLDLSGTWQGLRWPLAGVARYASAAGHYAIRGPLGALHLTGDADVGGSAVPLQALHASLKGQVSAVAPYPFTLAVDWGATLPDGPPVAGQGHLEGDSHVIRIQHHLREPASVITRGRIELAATPKLELDGSWTDLRWPLTGKAQYRSPSGTYHLRGGLEAYRLRLEAQLAGADLPSARLRLEGAGGPDQLAVEKLAVQALDGTADAKGSVRWSPHPAWDLQISAQNLNPERWRADVPGRLGFQVHTSGRLAPGKERLALELRRLSGTLRGQGVTGSGAVTWENGRLSVRSLDASAGDNRIHVAGTAGERLDLAFDVHAPTLGALWPGLQGQLTGSGKLRGSRANPALKAHVRGTDLTYGVYGAATLDADVNLDPRAPARSAADVTARDLRLAGRQLSEASLHAAGILQQHRLEVRLRGPRAEASADLNGGLAAGVWRGRLVRATLVARPGGTWRLAQALDLEVGAERVSMSRGCWTQSEGGRLCLEGRRAADGEFSATGELSAVPLSLADPWLPDGFEVEGVVDGHFAAQGKAGAVSGEAELTPRPGTLRYREAQTSVFATTYRDARLSARYREQRLRLAFGVALERDGRVAGELLAGAPDARGARPLQGRLNVQLPDIALAEPFVPGLDQLGGSFRLNADVGGTVDRPTVRGKAELRDGTAKLPQLGIEIRDLQLQAHNQGLDRIAFEGGLSSGGGRLAVQGDLALDPARGWPATLTITGQKVEVARLPEAHVFASPDLRVSASSGRVEINGKVRIPEAQIRLEDLPAGAVSVSSDQVIVNAQGEPVKPRSAATQPIVAKIEIILGDKVSFRGFGLQAGLEGSVQLESRPGQRTAQGSVSLRDGRYEAYGQTLTIERGHLIFTGPVDNPALDFRAVRKVADVTAGLNVSGTLKQPRSQVFSDPPMPEAEALSYLIIGKPLTGATQSQGQLMAQAALALGVQGSGMITQQLASTLGLDELQLRSGGTLEESSVVLGKYLTPDLYVSYALGLFDQAGTVTLNYRLTDHISLEGKSGENQSMDVIFKIERNTLLP